MTANTTEISLTSLERFAQMQSVRLHQARVDAFDAAVQAYLVGGVRAGEEALQRAWGAHPVDHARFLRALQWLVRDERLSPSELLACQPFTLERALPSGERYVLQGRVDALSRERSTLYVWASADLQGALIPAAYAVQMLRSRQVRVNRLFFDGAAVHPVVTGDVTCDEVEAQMREIDRLAAQWIAQFDASPPTLSITRTAERCRSIFQGWGPRLA